MKKRYTITVAGYKMNVISDDSSEEIRETVAALDRSVRTFCARTRSLPLTEAAMLAGLDAYAEKRRAQKRVRELEFELYDENGETARLRRELEELKRAVLELAPELVRPDAAAEADPGAEEAGTDTEDEKDRDPDRDVPDGTEDDGGVGAGLFENDSASSQLRLDF